MNIACPVCKEKLLKVGKTYQCLNKHNFDIAKQGYINLNMKASDKTGDNQVMIEARKNFLEKNYYQFLLKEINKLLSKDDEIIDLACGEGYYTKQFIAKEKIGLDLSKQGLKIASRNDQETTYILSSIFHCPLFSNSADKIITIFAPIAKEEIFRLLKDKGQFILVKPNKDHLYELKKAIYEHPYLNEIEDIEIAGLKLIKEIPISQKAILNNEDLKNLLMMTPYYNTTSKNDKEKLNQINNLEITFSFLIDIYQKN